jgi:molecular chaperone GrpE
MSDSRDSRMDAPVGDEEEPTVEGGEGEGEAAGVGEEGPGNGEAQVERLQAQLEDLNDRHLRLAAEFENFRRRSQTEMGQSGIRAQAALVERLLEVLDDFERMSSIDPDQATVESVLEGVDLVERKFHRILEDAGLERIEAEDSAFDPNSMEAMMREPADSAEDDDTVARVLQSGFRFRGQLVRPARVSVRKHE